LEPYVPDLSSGGGGACANISPQISPTNMRDLELSDGERTVLPVSRTRMVCKTLLLLFGMEKSQSIPERHTSRLVANFEIVISSRSVSSVYPTHKVIMERVLRRHIFILIIPQRLVYDRHNNLLFPTNLL